MTLRNWVIGYKRAGSSDENLSWYKIHNCDTVAHAAKRFYAEFGDQSDFRPEIKKIEIDKSENNVKGGYVRGKG